MGDVERATKGRLHSLDVGATPLVSFLCDADVRAELERTRKTPWCPCLYTLEDMEREGKDADNAYFLALVWGMELPPETTAAM